VEGDLKAGGVDWQEKLRLVDGKEELVWQKKN
jgi:hypothetical protein